MLSFDNLNKTDIFSATKAEDLETVTRTIMVSTSWMDEWTYSAKFMALFDSSDVKKVKPLFIARAYCQLLVTKTAFMIWANLSKC